MTREEKRTIFVLIILGIVIIGGLLIWRNNIEKKNNNVNIVNNGDIVTEEYVQKLEDGSKLNISEELQKTKTLNGLEISNIQLREIGGITTLLANVENKTGMQTYSKMVKVDILSLSRLVCEFLYFIF